MAGLTQEDVQHFGPELVDFSQRAAVQAVAPHLQQLEEQNTQLRRQLARETKRNLDLALERAGIPWQQINQSARWLAWLQARDVLSVCVRQTLLDEAVAKGDAARVINFFRGFLAEEGAVGQHGQAGPRQATTRKPIYTRAQITERAALRRKGAISDVDWAAWENELVAAGREGRIAGALSLDGR